MSNPKALVLKEKKCLNCPFFCVETYYKCNITQQMLWSKARDWTPPNDCPLRSGPVSVYFPN